MPEALDGPVARGAGLRLPRLTHLSLEGNGISQRGIEWLVGSPRVEPLRSLDLSQKRIGLEGVRALLESPHLQGLRGLKICHILDAELGDEQTDEPLLEFIDALDGDPALLLGGLPEEGGRLRVLSLTYSRMTKFQLHRSLYLFVNGS